LAPHCRDWEIDCEDADAVGSDYVYWIELYRKISREDLACALAWPGFAASPFSEFLRDELMKRYLTPGQLDTLRRRWRRIRSLFHRAGPT
jgi:hypothetical protein